MTTLRETFTAALPEPLRGQALAWRSLSERLVQIMDASRADGDFGVGDDAFLAYVAERVPEGAALEDALSGLHAAELRLACACVRGRSGAVEAFRARLGAAAATAAARVVDGDLVEEVVQETMTKLLVRGDEQPPAVAKYAGRGRLSKWVQTVALRLAHSRTRKRSEEPSHEIELLADRMIDGGDPELDALKRTYRAQFKRAFGLALEGLSPRQRNLLRLELLDRATIEAIANIHGVHPATVSRWRADTRAQLLKQTRRTFERELNVDRAEFQSIMRLIQSQLEVSLPRLLQEGDE